MKVERISAVTLRVANMRNSVRFYRDVLGMEIIYGGEDGCFSSLRAKDANAPILNLEQGHPVTRWGRMIFYVAELGRYNDLEKVRSGCAADVCIYGDVPLIK
jgi:catechol 2,3-dioxygenase-like lactoylglutathione lyase family enzyme